MWIAENAGERFRLRFRGGGEHDAETYLHIFDPLTTGNYQLLNASHPAYDDFPMQLRHNNKHLVLLIRIPTVEYVYQPEEAQIVPEANWREPLRRVAHNKKRPVVKNSHEQWRAWPNRNDDEQGSFSI